MKKFILPLLILLISTGSFCKAENLENTQFRKKLELNVNTAQSVVERANKMNNGSQNDGIDPISNSMMGGYYNMMQGMSGNFATNMQEMQKQQRDYVKQQMNNPSIDEE